MSGCPVRVKTKEFEYLLPERLIAQCPIEPRDSSKLLILNRGEDTVKEDIFRGVIDYLSLGDVLVLNDTKVIPARLAAEKISGGKVEVFLLRHIGDSRWEALVKPGSRIPEGTEVIIGGEIPIKVLGRTANGSRIIEFSSPEMAGLAIKRFGQTPLPPYIKRPLPDPRRYQTVYAKHEGSVAAPTAALHFTPELLRQIEDKGIEIVYITLHMGLWSFRPIKEEDIDDHLMPAEYYEVPEVVAQKVNNATENKRRVVACGTDVVRALESAADNGRLKARRGTTTLFITPDYKFRIVDMLITNLHLPCSTHLVLVSAFAGRDFIFKAYQHAINNGFRFYTFGDATLII
ncbi:tRNA preQ1(34) S-adenosylmethionine ribosyltransferase-isomerase QueA [Thermodesulfovibrionales bacterium]|nr:tRNA preQ1(34) S-adenosylmethionine ribosyltransferase-isomerase QueA [Thermodesulfovibrionales bacterium]